MPSPEDFYSATPPQRIIGTEMEYSAEGLDNSNALQYSMGKLGLKYFPSGSGMFAVNGSRVYIDVGGHVEYASPESLGPLEATATDHAGLTIIEQMSRIANVNRATPPRAPQRRAGAYDFSEGRIYTKGYHENYCIPVFDDKQNQTTTRLLESYLATRQLWGGNGFVSKDGYTMSQKVSGIGLGVLQHVTSQTAHGNKPMLTMQQNPPDKGPDWTVAEVRFSDPNMFPYSTFIGLAATSLVFRLVEQGLINPRNVQHYNFRKPLDVKDQLTYDIHGFRDTKYQLESGREITALELQKRLAKMAVKMSRNIDLPSDEQRAAKDWLTICNELSDTKMRRRNYSSLLGKVEWMTKYHFLREKIGDELDATNPRAVGFDLQWTDISERSIGRLVARRMGFQTNDFEQLSQHYIFNPPAETRAQTRAHHIDKGDIAFIDWSRIRTPQAPTGMFDVPMSNPYRTAA